MKNKIDYRLLNTLLIMGIIYIAIVTSGYWMGIITKIFKIILPFFFAFVLAYILHPFVQKLENKGIRRGLALTAVILIFFANSITRITRTVID